MCVQICRPGNKPHGNYCFKYQLLYLINLENLPCLSALVKENFTAFLENVKYPNFWGRYFDPNALSSVFNKYNFNAL
jgi:hypothetical protein